MSDYQEFIENASIIIGVAITVMILLIISIIGTWIQTSKTNVLLKEISEDLKKLGNIVYRK